MPADSSAPTANGAFVWVLSAGLLIAAVLSKGGWWSIGFALAAGIGITTALTKRRPEGGLQAMDAATPPLAEDPADIAAADALSMLEDAVIVVDPSNRVRYANRAAAGLFEVRSAAMGRLLPEASRNVALSGAAEESRRSGRPATATATDGERSVLVRATPLPDGRVVLHGRDESELKRLEKMRREFVANVSHELKTPLTSIRAYAETLQEGVTDIERVQGFAGRILEQSERLHELIIDLIRLAQAESNEPLDVQSVRLSTVVDDALAAARDQAERTGIRLAKKSPDLPPVETDPAVLRTALDNLIRNGIAYNRPDGNVTVTTEAAADAEGAWHQIHVQDTGVGIRPAEQQLVFDRFFRVERARTRSTGGSGLGLSIANQCVLRLGGRLTVESEVGVGSRFSIWLPS